jgi:protein tyrosine phosphatase
MLRSGLISVAAARENISRNRYSNILPLDSHRLVLPRNTLRTGKSDFINATLFQVRAPRFVYMLCALIKSVVG